MLRVRSGASCAEDLDLTYRVAPRSAHYAEPLACDGALPEPLMGLRRREAAGHLFAGTAEWMSPSGRTAGQLDSPPWSGDLRYAAGPDHLLDCVVMHQ